MKKFTLMMAAAAMTLSVSAQTDVASVTQGTFPTVITGTWSETLAPCDQMEPGNNGENGFGNTIAGTEVADDITVADGEMFTVESATINMITGGTFPSVTVRFYEDQGGMPTLTPLYEFIDIVPTSQDDIGDAFGRDILAVVVDFPAGTVLNGVDGSDTLYWMSIVTPNGTGADAFWETDATVTSNTTLVNFRDGADPTNPWANQFDPGTGLEDMPPAAVYMVSGDCSPLLSVGDNISDLVSVFPNPTNDVLNVRVPSNITVESAVMYDILGKNTGVRLVNGTINTSNLARGVYILNVRTSAGTLTEKIVKQ